MERKELERRGSREAVVDEIERELIDVLLFLPSAAVRIERKAVVVDPRAVLLVEVKPDLIPLCGRELRLLVDNVLELIDLAAVAGCEHRILRML